MQYEPANKRRPSSSPCEGTDAILLQKSAIQVVAVAYPRLPRSNSRLKNTSTLVRNAMMNLTSVDQACLRAIDAHGMK
jgi:hypothetical protein